MPDCSLRNCRVLIVEDEYILADELVTELGNAGAVIIGPAGTIGDALGMIAGEPRIDGAILDVNLRGEMVFPAADLLTERNVPFVFATGYDDNIFPSRFSHVLRCNKPLNITRVLKAIGRLIHD